MEPKIFQRSFIGTGMGLFKIQLVNFILTIITLGLYYPWAKATKLQYIYSNTIFEEHPLAFTGTGNEMFKGFIKAILFLTVAYIIFFGILQMGGRSIAFIFLYLFILSIIPLIIHGSYKYRMAKTVWKGIRFGYTGDRMELFKLFLKGIFLTFVTIGIYGAWFSMNLRKYVIEKIHIGDANFSYKGNGGDFFILNLKGYLLTIITLGIYFFWWQKDLFKFFVNNLELSRNDQKVYFKSTATGVDFFALLIINFLIVLFTLGLGYPWVIVRTLKFGCDHINMEGDLAFDELQQSQADYSDATGTDMADIFDFGFVI